MAALGVFLLCEREEREERRSERRDRAAEISYSSLPSEGLHDWRDKENRGGQRRSEEKRGAERSGGWRIECSPLSHPEADSVNSGGSEVVVVCARLSDTVLMHVCVCVCVCVRVCAYTLGE